MPSGRANKGDEKKLFVRLYSEGRLKSRSLVKRAMESGGIARRPKPERLRQQANLVCAKAPGIDFLGLHHPSSPSFFMRRAKA